MNIYYIVYQTTNLLNGMIYIGIHQTENLNDNYLGSGSELRKAIKEHGKENFQREILFTFSDSKSMLLKEAELVTPEFCLREDTYNIAPGGGGRGMTGRKQSESAKAKIGKAHAGKTTSEETKAKMSKAAQNKVFTEEHRRKISEANKLWKRPPMSEEQKEKLREAAKFRKPVSDETRRKLSEARKRRELLKSST